MRIDEAVVSMSAERTFTSEYEFRMEEENSFRSIFNTVSKMDGVPAGKESARDKALILEIRALIARMLEFLTGDHDFRGIDLREIMKTEQAAWPASLEIRARDGVEVERKTHITETIREYENTQFKSTGKIRTSDGRALDFTVELGMCRNYYCEREFTEVSKVVLRDPLVINFAGSAAELSGKRFEFDLDVDGKTESMHALAGGSGYLAIDSNGDGRINDGSELFGTRSGNGFADLAKLDVDGNHWLDERDAGFDALRIWQPVTSGEDSLSTLRERNVGALYLGSVETPFSLTDQENRMLASIRSSGIYLKEDGDTGTIQQLDLAV